jgi:two-component system, OmpR family, KDP operon response regulator KdpE
MRNVRVLIVDDEPAIARALHPALKGHEFDASTASTGADALAQISVLEPDIILLDLGLPDMDGIELTGELRKLTNAPIIVLSVRGADKDKIDALDSGADDYLTKPFSIGELLARIRVALRHREMNETTTPPEPLITGDLMVDVEGHRVTLKGEPVRLSPTEFNLLETLVRNTGKVTTHRTLLHKVWGPEYAGDTQLLRVYISQLRGKIEERPERPRYIVTEPGIGYRFREVD